MQNKKLIWTFVVILTLVSLYQLSFSWVTSNFENKAEKDSNMKSSVSFDKTKSYKVGNKEFIVYDEESRLNYRNALKDQYLVDNSKKSIYPIFGHSYEYCKNNQLSFGLDLSGGMSVAMEISVPELVQNIAGNSKTKNTFAKPYEAAYKEYTSKNNNADFISLFDKHFNILSEGERMSSIFKFSDETNSNLSNDQIIEKLRVISKEAIDKTETIISNRINSLGVNQPTIQKNIANGRIHIDLPGIKDKERARNMLQSTAKLEFWDTYKNTELGNDIFNNINKILSENIYPGFLDSLETAKSDTNKVKNDTAKTNNTSTQTVTNTAKDSSKNNTDSNVAKKEDTGSKSNNKKSNLSSADLQQEEFKKANPLSAFLYPYVTSDNQWNKSSILGYALLKDTSIINEYLNFDYVKNELPRADIKFLWDKSTFSSNSGEPLINLYMIKMPLNGEAVITGEHIESSRQDFDQYTGKPLVNLTFTNVGAKLWAEMTDKSSKEERGIAITLDGKVYSSPVASEKIEGGNTRISGGSFEGENGLQEAQDLSKVLSAGALPVNARIVDESIVGPELGKSNIQTSLISFIIALLLVFVYMFFYYNKSGIIADIALLFNIFLIFGVLASFKAALTLPGVAGIVLTIGMAVDANIIIYERIKEELRLGLGMKQAINTGFSKAFSAIIDSNITTLLTALVLWSLGSGPIKGFATTLIIGIFATLFTTLIISRLFFEYLLDKKKDITFYIALTKDFMINANYQFIKNRKKFYFLSLGIIVLGISMMFIRGLDFGVEYTGGRTYVIKSDQKMDLNKLKSDLTKAFEGDQPEVKMIDNEFKALITTQYLINSKNIDDNKKVEEKLKIGYKDHGNITIQESRQVDTSISNDFIKSSIYAIILSLIVMFIYILLRFKKWQFGAGAFVALIHDVLVLIGAFAMFWGILPFGMEVNQAFIAALLTLVGYSINDTVIVFDRIREYLGLHPSKDTSEVINDSLNNTLSRTINTSLTTFLTMLIIFIFGGDSLKGMTFALMLGIIVGTYSSLFIATPIVIDLSNGFSEFRKKKKL